MRLIAAILLFIAPAFPQAVIAFSPQASLKTGDVPWLISITSTSTQSIPIGKLYQIMIQNHITPLSFQSAYTALSTKPAKSIWGKILTYAGIGAAVTAAALATKTVSGNQNLTNAFTWASSGLSVAVNVASGQEPPVSPLVTQVPHDNDLIYVVAGGSGSTVILGSYQAAFVVTVQ